MHHQRWWDMQETHERNNRLQNTCIYTWICIVCIPQMYQVLLRKCSKCFLQNIQLRLRSEWQKSPRKYNQFHAIKWSFCMPGNSYTFFEGNFSSCRQFFRNIFFFSTFFFQISKVSLAQLLLNISIGIPVQPMRQIRRYNEFLRAFIYCVLFVRIMNSSSSSGNCAFCSEMDRQVECIRFMHELHYVRYQLDGRYIGI